jgi:hypothetical protein
MVPQKTRPSLLIQMQHMGKTWTWHKFRFETTAEGNGSIVISKYRTELSHLGELVGDLFVVESNSTERGTRDWYLMCWPGFLETVCNLQSSGTSRHRIWRRTPRLHRGDHGGWRRLVGQVGGVVERQHMWWRR